MLEKLTDLVFLNPSHSSVTPHLDLPLPPSSLVAIPGIYFKVVIKKLKFNEIKKKKKTRKYIKF